MAIVMRDHELSPPVLDEAIDTAVKSWMDTIQKLKCQMYALDDENARLKRRVRELENVLGAVALEGAKKRVVEDGRKESVK